MIRKNTGLCPVSVSGNARSERHRAMPGECQRSARLRLINAPGADFRRHQVNRVRSDDNILGIHLIDFRDGAGILIFTFHKQLLVILTNTNKAGFIQ